MSILPCHRVLSIPFPFEMLLLCYIAEITSSTLVQSILAHFRCRAFYGCYLLHIVSSHTPELELLFFSYFIDVSSLIHSSIITLLLSPSSHPHHMDIIV